MNALLSWVLLLSIFSLALYLAGGFSRALDRWVDRFTSADLDAVRRRDNALKVMESWHPVHGPKFEREAVCNCTYSQPREFDQTECWPTRFANPSCPVHTEES